MRKQVHELDEENGCPGVVACKAQQMLRILAIIYASDAYAKMISTEFLCLHEQDQHNL